MCSYHLHSTAITYILATYCRYYELHIAAMCHVFQLSANYYILQLSAMYYRYELRIAAVSYILLLWATYCLLHIWASHCSYHLPIAAIRWLPIAAISWLHIAAISLSGPIHGLSACTSLFILIMYTRLDWYECPTAAWEMGFVMYLTQTQHHDHLLAVSCQFPTPLWPNPQSGWWHIWTSPHSLYACTRLVNPLTCTQEGWFGWGGAHKHDVEDAIMNDERYR